MIYFAFLPTHLQVSIAEKMDCLEQSELEFSSRTGKHILTFIKHKPILDVRQILMDQFGKICRFYARDRYIEFDNSRGMFQIPRFKVDSLFLDGDVTLESLTELESAEFLKNEVEIVDTVTYHIVSEVFEKLATIFNVTKFTSIRKREDPDQLKLPMFREMKSIDMIADDIPHASLTALNATTIILKKYRAPLQIGILAKEFVQQWYEKRRNIDFLKLVTFEKQNDWLANSQLSQFPHVIVWDGCTHDKKWQATFLKEDGSRDHYELCGDHIVFLIDRGDRKLLIRYNHFIGELLAQEVVDVVVETN